MTTRSLLVAVILAVSVAGCSVNHRSNEFTCDTQADCPDGRTCSDGLCITNGTPTPDGPTGDGPPPPPDAFACPSQCTSCRPDSHTCVVNCNVSPATCNVGIKCPEGFNCEIACTTEGGCPNVDCSPGASCKVTCNGPGTCRNVKCGAGPCDISCAGQNSCRGVDCKDSCACDLACANQSSCFGGFVCPPGPSINACTILAGQNRGCTSEPTGCNTCP